MTSRKTLEEKVMNFVEEVINLRHGDAGDSEGPLRVLSAEDGVHALMHELQRTRKRSDRIAYIRAQLGILRAKLKIVKAESDFKAESKSMETLSARNKVKVDFESADAIRADAGLEAFQERREAHEAKMALEIVNDGYAVIDKICYEMDSLRNDQRAIIKALQFESTLEH